MQFIADTVKKMNEKGYLTIKDLYTLPEAEVIDKIENCEDKYIAERFKMFRNACKINESDTPVADKYCINLKSKRRYIVPLTIQGNGVKRINEVSNIAKQKIENYLAFETKPYAYLDFDF